MGCGLRRLFTTVCLQDTKDGTTLCDGRVAIVPPHACACACRGDRRRELAGNMSQLRGTYVPDFRAIACRGQAATPVTARHRSLRPTTAGNHPMVYVLLTAARKRYL